MKSRFFILASIVLIFTIGVTGIAQILPETDDQDVPEKAEPKEGGCTGNCDGCKNKNEHEEKADEAEKADDGCTGDCEDCKNKHEHADKDEVTEDDCLIFEGSLFEFLNFFSEKYRINVMSSYDTQRIFVNIRLYKKLTMECPGDDPNCMNIEDFLFILLDNYGFEYECLDDIFVINRQMPDSTTVTETFHIIPDLDFRDIVRQFGMLMDRRLDKMVYNEDTRIIFFTGSQRTVELLSEFYEQVEMALEEKLENSRNDIDETNPDEPPAEDAPWEPRPIEPETPETPESEK